MLIPRPRVSELGVVVALWGIPVLLALLSVGGQAVQAAATAAGALSIGVALFRPVHGLAALPFLALLSPVAGYVGGGEAAFVLSDLLVLVLAAQLLVRVAVTIQRPRVALPSPQLVLLLLTGLGCTVGVVWGTLTTLKPLLYVVQLGVVYWYTVEHATTEAEWSLVVSSWLAAATLASLLVVRAYLSGVDLSAWAQSSQPVITDRAQLTVLFRARHYYAGFHHVLGMSIVIACLKVVFAQEATARWWNGAMLLVMLACLLAMLNMTSVLSVVVSLVILLALLPPRPSRRALRYAAVALGALVVVAVAVGGRLGAAVLGAAQFELFVGRAVSASTLLVRLQVYRAAVAAWLSHPVQVLFGMGPDFLVNSGAPSLSAAFKTSVATGLVEGTVDSGWLSYLIELGVIPVVLVVWLGIKVLGTLVHALRKSEGADAVVVYVCGGLLFFSVSTLTQVVGYGKVAWAALQLFGIGVAYIRAARERGGPVALSAQASPSA